MSDQTPQSVTAIERCRICAGTDLTGVLDLGDQPSADLFPPADDPGPDPRWPLRLVLCAGCGLLQLAHTSPHAEEPRAVESQTSRRHAVAVADRVAHRAGLGAGARVLECSSAHGGSWAQALAAAGFVVSADDLSDEAGLFDLVIDNHSMIHDEDTDGALARRAARVGADGVLAIEFHHALAFLVNGQFDTVRHGHPVYLSLHAWRHLCHRHGFEVIDAWSEDVYGGCLVVLARRGGTPNAAVTQMLAAETAAGLTSPDAYGALADTAARIGGDLRTYLVQAAARGARVAGYGAGSKAALLVGFSGIDRTLLSVTADMAPAKQGRRIPGTDVPIVAPEALVASRPDQVVILLWDLADEVIRQLTDAGLTTTRFVVPAPELRVLDPAPSQPQATA